MRQFFLLYTLIAGIYQTPIACTENGTLYKDAGYSFIGKSALASTAVVIALAAGYGLWTWWNKKAKDHGEQTNAPATPEIPESEITEGPVGEKESAETQVSKGERDARHAVMPRRKTSTPTQAEALAAKKKKMEAAKDLANKTLEQKGKLSTRKKE